MQNYAAVFRTGDVLKEGVQKIYETYQEMADLKVKLCFSVWYITVFTQPAFACSKRTVETPEQCEICSKLRIKTPGRRQ